MGLLVAKKKSMVALLIAIIVFGLDGILMIIFGVAQGSSSAAGGVAARVVFLLPMIKGVGALKALKAKKAQN